MGGTQPPGKETCPPMRRRRPMMAVIVYSLPPPRMPSVAMWTVPISLGSQNSRRMTSQWRRRTRCVHWPRTSKILTLATIAPAVRQRRLEPLCSSVGCSTVARCQRSYLAWPRARRERLRCPSRNRMSSRYGRRRTQNLKSQPLQRDGVLRAKDGCQEVQQLAGARSTASKEVELGQHAQGRAGLHSLSCNKLGVADGVTLNAHEGMFASPIRLGPTRHMDQVQLLLK